MTILIQVKNTSLQGDMLRCITAAFISHAARVCVPENPI